MARHSGRLPVLAVLLCLIYVGRDAAALGEKTDEPQQRLHESVEPGGPAGNSAGGSLHKEFNFDVEKELTEDFHATMRAYVENFEKRQVFRAKLAKVVHQKQSKSELLDQLIGSPLENQCGINESSSPARENLVVLPAGDSFDAAKWMNDTSRSNWDVIVIYYGKSDEYRCPLCKAVYRASGAKWRLAWGFTLLSEWQEYRQQYKAIMFADDDLDLDMCVINTVFSVMEAYKLLMAQPSLCREEQSYTPWQALYQRPENILRYTTMIEIMAPTFEMDFFQNFIRPSLYNAYVGWGLDFVWPFLLKYPRDKIAVIDQVCMSHPPSAPNKANSVYSAVAPYRKKEEETRRFAEYGYFRSDIEKLGFHHMAVEVVGKVAKGAQRTFLEQSAAAWNGVLGPWQPGLFMLLLVLVCCLLLWRQRLRRAKDLGGGTALLPHGGGAAGSKRVYRQYGHFQPHYQPSAAPRQQTRTTWRRLLAGWQGAFGSHPS